ncbi:hypothetical protein ACFWGI_06590 [Streptomyces niveus]|uniref:hypothetical protein n=1 Tax=Streptomyces niveus TaxID=193462 RepID=UPI00365B5E9A
MAADERDLNHRAAVAALPPGSCPLLVPVDEVRVRRHRDEPWQWVDIPEGSAAEAVYTGILMHGLNDTRDLDLVDPGSLRTVYRHLEPCLLCRHRAAPGPRVYGLWCGDPQLAAEWQQGRGAPDLRSLTEIANATAAEEQARDVARLVGQNRDNSLSGIVRLTLFQVPTDDQLPRFHPILVQSGSELWLWRHQPVGKGSLCRPDRVLRIGDDASVSMHDGPAAAAARPRPPEAEPEWSPFKTATSPDGRTLTWYDNGNRGLLVSTLDPQATHPAVRITAQGEEPITGAPAGLTVFGHGIATRPSLAALPRLAPRFADLAPAPATRNRRRARPRPRPASTS